ncbi:pleckstrin homology domain-containing family A member 1-like [Dysidea avara]|uniref:pleckstrin homology domain-containing family A member 1-like n=1 Tax=Dysidea avara TaxID=196820 RepID=UPI00331EC1C3
MAESLPPADIIKEGFLSKQGGVYHVTWKKRYFILRENSLSYSVKKDNSKPKKIIDLTEGRGVREKEQCATKKWPGDAKFCFGVALPKRTWYFYGSDDKDIKEWMELIQQCIVKVGNPTEDWENDIEGKQESVVSKAFRSTTKTAVKHGKGHIPSTGDKYLDGAISTAADVAENQIDADPNVSMKDRMKMAGDDMISVVADTVGNPALNVAANVAKDQLEADEDLSLKQRLALAGGSVVEGGGEHTKKISL